MNPTPYGPHVRVMCRPAAAPSCDLCVEVRDTEHPQGWRELKRFNDMSDDFAQSNDGRGARVSTVLCFCLACIFFASNSSTLHLAGFFLIVIALLMERSKDGL
jgi:hypothetical protein